MFKKLITYGSDLKMKIEKTSLGMEIKPMELIRRVLVAGFNLKEFRIHWDKTNGNKRIN